MRSQKGRVAGPRKPRMSIQLDPLMWEALHDIAARQRRSVHDLVSEITHDAVRLAIHVYIAEFYRSAPAEDENDTPKCSNGQ
jgi:predicted DNA-binding ribbon-helix-helix protein